MSVVQYKWPNQFGNKALINNDYREHYIFGDPILVWDESSEEIQYLGKLDNILRVDLLSYTCFNFHSLFYTQTFQFHLACRIVE